MELNNQVAFVTGGASGMGAATARLLSKNGAKVAILDVNKEAAEKMANEIGGLAVTGNVSDEKSIEDALTTVTNKLGNLRICINCAGIVRGRRIVDKQGPMPLAQFKEVIDINLVGTFNVMRLAAASMQSNDPLGDSGERGIIINTASVAAFEGQIGQCAYSASKGGVVALAIPAARELARFGIRVMTIAPGLVDTPMLQNIPEDARADLIANVPFPHRLVKPEEYAKLVKHIIENEMLNGEVIRLDGALRMQAK